ncbi:MAG: undecaprenyl-diphosphate phosphatase [Candidatus Marinimicrobia bacterium]|nr:undecaprenyl-diphosphate phosphatase [Candidatus Neomarinimicrobiota bacterium]
MTSILDALLLGLLQGATEFLPVSSSAHLVIAQYLLGIDSPGLVLEVALHMGTLLSVLIYFRKDIWSLAAGTFRPGEPGVSSRQEVGLIFIATVPAVVAALVFKDAIDAAFDSLDMVGWMLLVTTAVLISSRWAHGGTAGVTAKVALILGLAQALAIMPGISRSGMTIVAGLWLGMSGTEAARFSFLMAIPAILGAGLLSLGSGMPGVALLPMGTGMIVSALAGYVVIAWLMDILRRGRLYFFGGYTLLAGLIVIFAL